MKKLLIILALLIAVSSVVRAGDITPQGLNQSDLVAFLTNVVTVVNGSKSTGNTSVSSAQNQPLESAAIVKGGVASATFTSTVAIDYVIADAFYALPASSPLGIATAPVAQVATTTCIYLVSVDASGNYTWTKGANAVYGGTPICPAVPASECPIAEIKVDLTGAASSFTLGATAFNATGTTVTVTNIRRPRTGTSSLAAVSSSDLSLTGL